MGRVLAICLAVMGLAGSAEAGRVVPAWEFYGEIARLDYERSHDELWRLKEGYRRAEEAERREWERPEDGFGRAWRR